MTRRLFLWQKDVDEQKEKVGDMRRKNEALVYNILPPHVAIHFLGKRKTDEVSISRDMRITISSTTTIVISDIDQCFRIFFPISFLGDFQELYSKSYECVGVLFASMPNFSDFYTEESVNNQGLECLRFLNEVISDYDTLLAQPRFKDIFKIKTISSTYMAASGLNNEETSSSSSNIKEKWSHLAQLTDFALTLKETLNTINKESFNNFVLRIGMFSRPLSLSLSVNLI